MKKTLSSVFIFSAFVNVAIAQWNSNPAIGTPVDTTSSTTTKTGNVAVSDGANGMFTAWVDNRSATVPAIYIQRILSDGTLKFASGVLLSNAAGATSSAKSNLTIVADGTGGAICIWQDSRNRATGLSNDDIYGQRIDANGNVLWAANGVRLSVSDNTVSNKIGPAAELVNATEAIVVFGDNRSGTSDLYAQKFAISNGATQWVADVSLHGAQANTQTAHVVLKDGSGGLFVVWQDPRLATTNSDIYGQLINNAGVIQWAAIGVVICNAANNQLTPQIVPDNSGGLVATWSDQRLGSSDANIFAQRIDGLGAPQWTANGVAVNTAANGQSNPYIANSGSNFVIGWSDNRTVATGDRNIYAQSLDNTGALLWTPADGVAVVTATGNQPNNVSTGLQLVNDGTNNVVFIWEDARAGSALLDLYAQKLSTAGATQWAANGVVVSSATANQQGPVAVPSLANSIIVSWRDSRTSTNGEIYAARLQPNGVLPLRSMTVSAVTKNATVDVRWNTVDEENTLQFIVEKSSNGLLFSPIGAIQAKGAGNGAYMLTDNRPVKGMNYYRIKSVDVNKTFIYSLVVPVHFNGAATASFDVYPNPVRHTAKLYFVNVEHGLYSLKVNDFTGRLLHQQQVSVNGNYKTLDIPLNRFNAGSYIIQLEKPGGVLLSKIVQKD